MKEPEKGPKGERGPAGDHGQTGEEGRRGRIGETGATGPAYNSWLTRNVTRAYVVLCVGFILSLIFTVGKFDNVAEDIQKSALSNCQAGNERTLLERESLLESQRQTENFDLEQLLGLSKAQAEEVRRISRRNIQDRLNRLPYLDCVTGERTTLPPLIPSITSTIP